MIPPAADVDDLFSVAFLLRVRPGMTAEYRRRHAELWPEMAAALRSAGIERYEIYLCEETRQVFGLQLRRPGPPPQTEAPVIARWRAYMADVLEMDGAAPRRMPVERVFLLTSGRAGSRTAGDLTP